MDDKLNALDKLIEAVEAGALTEDQALWNGGCLPMCYSTWLAYEGSLDAALALHEALLPGQDWSASPSKSYAGNGFNGEASTPARAWLLAILRAYRSVQA